MESPFPLKKAFDAYLEAREKLKWASVVEDQDFEGEAARCWAELERLLIDSARKA